MNTSLLDLRTSSESVSKLPPKCVITPPPVTLPPPGRCNKFLNGTTGQFSPPDNPYRSNTKCAWLIEVPKGHEIKLIFHDVEIEYVSFVDMKYQRKY